MRQSKPILLVVIAIYLGPASAMAQDLGTPDWNISKIQLPLVKSIDGLNQTTIHSRAERL